MKRKLKNKIPYNGKYYHALSKFYSIFKWYKCCHCDKEFRREDGWSAFAGINNMWPKYLCHSCAPNIEDAYNLFENKKICIIGNFYKLLEK
jgi:transposase-like protein